MSEYQPPLDDAGKDNAASSSGDMTPAADSDVEHAEAPFPITRNALLLHLIRSEQHHSSPLPPPKELQEMEHLLPGSFERLLAMVEQKEKNARESETKSLAASIADREAARKESFLGLIFGLIVAVLGFGVCVTLALLGHPVPATFLGFLPLATLVGVFVIRKNQESKPDQDDD